MPAAPAAAPAIDAEPAPMGDTSTEPTDELDFGGAPESNEETPSNDKPFDDQPFDAGVEADEQTDPKKFIEQLSGKLGQSLRKYTEEQGQPDFELEKFAINSVISATHTSEMDEEDKNDIIKKINTSGENDSKDNENDSVNSDGDNGDTDGANPDNAEDNQEGLEEFTVFENFFLKEPKRNNMFQPSSNDILNENEEAPSRYMFFSNLEQIRRQAGLLLEMDHEQIESILNSGHDWAADHIATAKESFDQVFDFLMNETKGDDDEVDYSEWSKPMKLNKDVPVSSELEYHIQNEIALGESEFRYGSDKFFKLVNEIKKLHEKGLIELNENDEFIINDYENGFVVINEEKVKVNYIMEDFDSDLLNEAEYQGKKVQIGKPKRGGSKKFYVYVRNPKTGKVKKVSFGAKSGGGNLAVKLRDPKARKAFADRHNCEQKNDKTKPGYWACRLPRYAKLLGLSGGGRWW